MPRSVRVHPDHQTSIAGALERNGFLTQGNLAVHLEIALSTVNNFCRGLNVSISKFEQICEALGLDKKAVIKPATSDQIAEHVQQLVNETTAPTSQNFLP